MFDMHSKGDILAYLKGQGFTCSLDEDLQDLRAAASLHAQVVALERSSVFKQVLVNAERVLRSQGIAGADTLPPGCYAAIGDEADISEDGEYYGYDELF